MKFVVSVSLICVVCAIVGRIAKADQERKGPQCPAGCLTEVGENGKTICNCCREKKDEEIPLLDACAGVRCLNGRCVNTICPEPELCGNNAAANCNGCIDEPTFCPDGQIIVYRTDGCKFCHEAGPDFVNACAGDTMCKESSEECTLQQVNCFTTPCNLKKRCRKVCPVVDCLTGCGEIIKRDGCPTCRCCKYEL